jgi:hypothetical protein
MCEQWIMKAASWIERLTDPLSGHRFNPGNIELLLGALEDVPWPCAAVIQANLLDQVLQQVCDIEEAIAESLAERGFAIDADLINCSNDIMTRLRPAEYACFCLVEDRTLLVIESTELSWGFDDSIQLADIHSITVYPKPSGMLLSIEQASGRQTRMSIEGIDPQGTCDILSRYVCTSLGAYSTGLGNRCQVFGGRHRPGGYQYLTREVDDTAVWIDGNDTLHEQGVVYFARLGQYVIPPTLGSYP